MKLVASTVWLIVFSVVVNSGGGCSTVVVVMYTVYSLTKLDLGQILSIYV